VMIRTNMITSGYASKIPIVEISNKAKRSISSLARKAYVAKASPESSLEYVRNIDGILFEELAFSYDDQSSIKHFCKDLLKLA
jgi:hypothetical protein